jgi:hypothetical protein
MPELCVENDLSGPGTGRGGLPVKSGSLYVIIAKYLGGGMSHKKIDRLGGDGYVHI